MRLAQLFDQTDQVAFLNQWAGVVSFIQQRETKKAVCRTDHLPATIVCNKQGCIINNVFSNNVDWMFTSYALQNIEKHLNEQYFIAKKAVQQNNHSQLKKQLETMSFIVTYHDWLFKLLMYAIDFDAIECLKILLQNNRRFLDQQFISWGNNADDRGGTFLHLGVLCSNVKAIKLLMKYGVDPLFVNNDRKTPVRFACDLKKDDCLDVIQKFMIKQYLIAIKKYNYKRGRQLIEELMQTDVNRVQRKGFLLISLMARLKSSTKIFDKTVQGFFNDLFDQGNIFAHQVDAITRKPLFWTVVQHDNLGLTLLFLQQGAVVSAALLANKKISSRLRILLKSRYENQCLKIQQEKEQSLQRCCICLDRDNPETFFDVPCKNNHPKAVVCFRCSEHIAQCPLCRTVLL